MDTQKNTAIIAELQIFEQLLIGSKDGIVSVFILWSLDFFYLITQNWHPYLASVSTLKTSYILSADRPTTDKYFVKMQGLMIVN